MSGGQENLSDHLIQTRIMNALNDFTTGETSITKLAEAVVVLNDIFGAVDELEIKAENINLNTDDLESKLDTLNAEVASQSTKIDTVNATLTTIANGITALNTAIGTISDAARVGNTGDASVISTLKAIDNDV